MKIHPNEPTLQELFEQLSRGSLRILEHVLGCPECREQARRMLAAGRKPPSSNLIRLPVAELSYDSVLESASLGLRCQKLSLDQERREAKELFLNLEKCPPERRILLLRNSSRHQTWGMLELLLERSRRASFDDSYQVEHWAELGLLVIDQLDSDSYGASRLEDIRCRAWSYIGNARRIRSELETAEEAFRCADSCLHRGTGDPLERAMLLDFKASLRKVQRRFNEAQSYLERAINTFLEAGETHRAGKSLIKLATVYEDSGEAEEGIPLLQRAIPLIDSARDPRLLFAARHNLIILLAGSRRILEAQNLLAQIESQYDQFPQGWAQSRLRWARARIALGTGRFQEAERYFLEARAGFVSDNALYDASLVALELASLYAEQRRPAEMRRLAEEVVSFFEPLKLERERQSALRLLEESRIAERRVAPTPPTPSPSRGTPRPRRQSRR